MGDYIFQGIIGYVLLNSTGSEMKPMYKLYNPITESFLTTTDYNEAVANSNGSNLIPIPIPFTDKIIMFSELPDGVLKKENNDLIGLDENDSNFGSEIDGDSLNSITSPQHVPHINIKIKDKIISSS